MPSYEDNFERLHNVVEKLEQGNLPLEESLQLFEEGMKLVQVCDGQLAQAQERVKVLMDGQSSISTSSDLPLEAVPVDSVLGDGEI